MPDIAETHTSAVIAVHGPERSTTGTPMPRPQRRRVAPWLSMSVAAVLVAAAGNVAALAGVGDVYGRETSAFVDQALAQDIVNLVVVAPTAIVLALLARRGSMTAHLLWLGVISFVVYNYVIYTLSVHAGALYLPWVAVLGMAVYALIGGLSTLDHEAVRARSATASVRPAGWFLCVVAVAFTVLWLSDIVPALMSGVVPEGAQQLGLPSSPVHVLDLAFYLPATFAAGIALLRHQSWGYAIGPGLLAFLTLTGLPILLTPFVASARGYPPTWAAFAPVAVVTVASLATLLRLLSTARSATSQGEFCAH
jgi:hypothetical protein